MVRSFSRARTNRRRRCVYGLLRLLDILVAVVSKCIRYIGIEIRAYIRSAEPSVCFPGYVTLPRGQGVTIPSVTGPEGWSPTVAILSSCKTMREESAVNRHDTQWHRRNKEPEADCHPLRQVVTGERLFSKLQRARHLSRKPDRLVGWYACFARTLRLPWHRGRGASYRLLVCAPR